MKKSDINNTPASRTQTKIGAITIGQSPRTDITGDICPLLAPNITLQEYGALDPFDADYINQNFAPGPDSSVLVTRMRDASQVIIGEEHILLWSSPASPVPKPTAARPPSSYAQANFPN